MRLGMLSTAALFGATMLFGQGMGAQTVGQPQIPRETDETVKVEGQTTTQTINSTTTIGRVTGFRQGKSVTVTTPSGQTTFDLSKANTTVVGNPNVRVGELVSVTELSEAGRRTINIQPYRRGVRTDTVAETAIMQAETRASGQVPYQVERTVKQEVPGTTTETKTLTAVGKVTAYSQGGTLTITAPHNRTRKFDLRPDGLTVTGERNVQVGQLVKVTEVARGEHRTINIQPVAAGSQG